DRRGGADRGVATHRDGSTEPGGTSVEGGERPMNEHEAPERGLTVAIIPARGGSKGVPGKILRPVGGMPLIERAVRAASAAAGVDLVVVSTDARVIAAVAERAGARVVARPADLSGDT